MKVPYTQQPGRGLMNKTAYELRMNYLSGLVDGIEGEVKSETLELNQLQNNIESFIGTIEIPLGLIGPLLFLEKDKEPEWVHTAVATTEGALAASMNRGVKAISECGGFRAHIVHQKMLRTPMFTFSRMSESMQFDQWIKSKFDEIKEITKKHSNYANLLEITSVIVGKIVHLKFIYSTSDASGQNMTTSCTWHACLWIDDQFQKENDIEILHFVIDGNGASDKKVSFYSIQNGRGTNVISECFLTNDIIEKTLRTTASDMFRSFNHSMAISRLDGMIGYNINVANAVAGIFGATGQDLACIHESSIGILQMEQSEKGLYLSLTLPNLVVGTVGGGTHLPVATKVLQLMDCKGVGKSGRFAKMIAGFALSLEISTLAAIVSGQFARAHQKLGRNKPINWLHKSEVDTNFFRENMTKNINSKVESISLIDNSNLDNGILMELTSKVSKKLIGFIEADVTLENKEVLPILIKSKALGEEVIDGLRFMASNLDSNLADVLSKHKNVLEYKNSNNKEIEVYRALNDINYSNMPIYYGDKIDTKREVYLFFIERLNTNEMQLFNSENSPDKWTKIQIQETIKAIHSVHNYFSNTSKLEKVPSVTEFDVSAAFGLYKEFIKLNRRDYDFLDCDKYFDLLIEIMENRDGVTNLKKGKLTLVHNDFNPRNIGIRNNGTPCIYDWELSCIDLPQRDIFEFLAFTFEEGDKLNGLEGLLDFHYNLVLEFNDSTYSKSDYISDFKLSGENFILSRVNFYLAGSTLVNYPFIERMFKNAMRILEKL
jgi:hydroxymethylglutaryl-CoA reductase (NADPH)